MIYLWFLGLQVRERVLHAVVHRLRQGLAAAALLPLARDGRLLPLHARRALRRRRPLLRGVLLTKIQSIELKLTRLELNRIE